jgi:hypothetical protein
MGSFLSTPMPAENEFGLSRRETLANVVPIN